MSELKAITVLNAYQLECNDNDLVYLKTDVDKVLAENDAEIRRLKHALYKACFNWAHFAVAFFAEYKTKEKWRKMENKCLAKAELYR